MWALKIPINKLHLIHRPFEPVSSLSEGFAGGVNFGLFSRSSSHPAGSYPVGGAEADGKIVCARVVPGWPALMHQPDKGVLDIAPIWGLNPAYAHTYRILIQAGPRLVAGGAVQTDYSEFADTRPGDVTERIAAGILDGTHVLIMAREDTMRGMAEWALSLGCTDALGGDGGSSGQVVMADEDGELKLVWGNAQLVPNALCWDEAEILVRPSDTAPETLPETPPGTPRLIPASDIKVLLNLKHFEPWEFACPHCNRILITRESVETMYRLDAMREEYGSAIGCVPRDRSLARGYTCKERGGHEPNSRHYPPHGDGRDISVLKRSQSTLEPFVLEYFSNGGIGVYSWGYHVDLGPQRRWGDKILPLKA
jgi:hypothetical protein